MKKTIYMALISGIVALSGCQNKDIEIVDPILSPVPAENFSGSLEGDDYVWTWPSQGDKGMQVQVLNNNLPILTEVVNGSSFTHRNVDTNIAYTYIFKVTDGTNLSLGTICYYTRHGASQIQGISMSQIDNPDGSYSAQVSWNETSDASTINFSASNGSTVISKTLDGKANGYVIENVKDGEEWSVTVTAENNDGKSLPSYTSLLIGKTAVGFLSIYPDVETLISEGDDDEACAWLWLNAEYPAAQYIYFGDIASADDLEPYRVLFWLRDLEDVGEDVVFTMPEVVQNATPAITEWYKNGGNLLLWSHATVYIADLGRVDGTMMRNNDRNIATGVGGWNQDVWKMSVELNPGFRFKKDASSHPIFRGLDVETTETTKLIAFKGPGWTEDHNCLFFNWPSILTGLGNQDEACYNEIVNTFGIIPLGTWDSQIEWVSQLNVWEAQKGNTEYNGTVICIGNGGCEFSMKNADGSKDISAYPKNNPYQGNVLKLAKNSIEYLKTR